MLIIRQSFPRDRQPPASALIERPVGELCDVEWVGDSGGVREHRVEHGATAGGQIKRGPFDLIQSLLVTSGEPPTRLSRCPAWDDIEQLASAHVNDLRRPRLGAKPTHPGEQRLVEPERGDGSDPVGVIGPWSPRAGTAAQEMPQPRSSFRWFRGGGRALTRRVRGGCFVGPAALVGDVSYSDDVGELVFDRLWRQRCRRRFGSSPMRGGRSASSSLACDVAEHGHRSPSSRSIVVPIAHPTPL